MFHLAAFSEDIDPAGAYAYLTAAAAEQTLTTSGDDIMVPTEFPNIIGAIATLEGTADLYARLISPSLRRIGYLMVPFSVDVVAITDGRKNYLWPENPIALSPYEQLNAQINSNPAAAVEQSVLVFLSDGSVTPITGEIHHIAATAASLTTVSASWALTTLSLTDDLPAGRYAVVGATCTGANAVAFRFVPAGGGPRPGGLVLLDEDDNEHPLQRNGGLGTWFEFDTTQLPKMELLCGDTAGAGAYNVILDVIQLASL